MTNLENILNNTIINLRVRQIYEPKLSTIVLRLEQLKTLINNNNIKQNPIRGIVRAYLDIFSDYEDPIIKKMEFLEQEVERIIKSN